METHMIFETHAHYDDEAFEADQEEILNSMQECGIGRIVNACASIESLKDTELLMEKYPFVYGAFGIHPDDADKMTQETLDEIRKLCQLPKAVAVGEIGLDYYWHKEEAEHELQKKMFRAQMEIAREQKMPFMIHSREAAKDTLDIVKDYVRGGMYGGIIHCFSYAKEMAREYLDMGLYLGIGLALSASYILFQTISSTLAINADWPSALAVWLPNIIFTIIAFFLYKKAPR